jgi:cytochrome c-type biogenesis protein CcmH
MKRVFSAGLLGLFLASFWAGVAFAQAPTPSPDDVNRIAKQLFCPVCENTPLDVCPTQACAQWRELIRQKLAEGWSDERIKQYFVDQYGARVLAEPPRTGLLNWLVYLVPPVLFIAGIFILVQVMRSMRITRPAVGTEVVSGEATPASGGSDDPYIAKLEEELRSRK